MIRLALAVAAFVALAGTAGWGWLHRSPPLAPPAFEAPTAPAPRALGSRGEPMQPVTVYVAGEVVRPGVYRLPPGGRIVDALRAAGEAKPEADLVAVNLAAPLHDGDEIAVPVRGALPPAAGRRLGRRTATAPRNGRRSRRAKRPEAPSEPVDINHADAVALAALPGIGRSLADRIVAFRQANGPFESAEGLADVAGITDRRLEAILPYIVVR